MYTITYTKKKICKHDPTWRFIAVQCFVKNNVFYVIDYDTINRIPCII